MTELETQTQTQSTSARSSQNADGHRNSRTPPNTSTGLNKNKILTKERHRSKSKPPPKLKAPYKAGPIMNLKKEDKNHPHFQTVPQAHPPLVVDTRPQMRLRPFRSGHVELEPCTTSRAITKPARTPPPILSHAPDVPLMSDRPLFLDDPDDFLDSSLGTSFDILSQKNRSNAETESQWPVQTQAPYDFNSQPVQSQWKAFADSQSQ